MAKGRPARISMEDNPFLAVRVGAAEARRLNRQMVQLRGSQYINPALLAFERLRAGLLRYTNEERCGLQDPPGDLQDVSPFACSPGILPETAGAGPTPDRAQNDDSPNAPRESGDGEETLLGIATWALDFRLQHAGQDDSGREERQEISEDLHAGHHGRKRHEDEARALVGDGRDEPDPEAEPDSLSPALSVERRPDPPVHVGE